jgi:DNA polymerase III alpha subunit (gram-positive type)
MVREWVTGANAVKVGAVIAIAALIFVYSDVSSSSQTSVGGSEPVWVPYVDMHVHTTESDGDRTAEEQIKTAASLGMKHMWITDHDMIRDLPRTLAIQEEGRRSGITVGFGKCERFWLTLVGSGRAAVGL